MNIQVCVILLIVSSINEAGTIVVLEESFQRVEDPSNRELIIPDAISASHLLNELAKTLDCLVTFVESHMNQLNSRISIFFTETNDAHVSMFYSSKFQEVRPTYILTDEIGNSSDRYSSLDALLIVTSSNNLANLTSELIDICARDCRYGVLITTVLPDEQSFMEEANNSVELLWLRGIATAVIFGTVGETLFAAQSQSFRANELVKPADPIMIGSCTKKVWIEETEIFPRMKMNSSKVHYGALENQPYSYAARATNGTFAYMRGLENFIVQTLAGTLNFKGIASLVEWGKGTTVKEEIVEEFRNSRFIDLIIGGLRWAPMEGIEFATSYEVVHIVWMVPANSNLSLLGLISPFSPRIWYVTIASLIFGGVLKYFLFKKMSFLEIFAIVMGVGWPNKPTILSYRIKYISWIFFGFILTQVYLASLAGQLMAHHDEQMDTMQELVDSGLSLGGTATHRELFALQGDKNEEASISAEIYDKFIVFEQDEYGTKFQDLINGKNASLALVVELNISSLNTNIDKHTCHTLKEVIASCPIAFAARKGCPYLRQIDETLARFIQGGFISLVIKKRANIDLLARPDEEHVRDDNLRLKDIAPGFLLLIMGYTAGVLCLFGEFVADRWFKREKRRKLKMKIKMEKLKKTNRKRVRCNAKKVLKPNTTIGYSDRNGTAWRIA